MFEFRCVLHKNGWIFFHLHENWKMWQTSQNIHQPSKFPTSQFELTHRNKLTINVATREPFVCHFPVCFWWMQHAVAPLPSSCAAPLGGALVLYWTFDSPIQATTGIFSMCKIFLYLNPQWGYLSMKRNTCRAAQDQRINRTTWYRRGKLNKDLNCIAIFYSLITKECPSVITACPTQFHFILWKALKHTEKDWGEMVELKEETTLTCLFYTPVLQVAVSHQNKAD